MWNRRDQVQAYQFLRRRLVAALVEADPNTPERPARRLTVAVAAGAAVGVLVLAVVGVLGIVRRNAPSDWASSGKIVIERETGAKFVVDPHGVLLSVLNSTSAMIYYGKRADTVVVGSADIAGHQRGDPVGIPNAPDSPPTRAALVTGPWTVCSHASLEDTGPPHPTVAVIVGWPPGTPPLAGDRAVVVRHAGNDVRYIVTAGRRYRVPAAPDLSLLGLPDRSVPVAAGWLDLLPQGADLAPVDVPDAGAPGPVLAGRATTVGQVFAIPRPAGGRQLFVMLPAGLSRLDGELPAQLLLAGTGGRAGNPDGRPSLLNPGVYVDAPHAVDTVLDLPAAIPTAVSPVGPQVSLCATEHEPGAPVDVRVFPTTPGPPGLAPAPALTLPRGTGLAADTVYVPPGHGALVRAAAPGPAARLPVVSLLTDQGGLYPLVTPAVTAALGYGDVAPTAVDPLVLRLLPAGVSLYTGAVKAPPPPGDLQALGPLPPRRAAAVARHARGRPPRTGTGLLPGWS